jgi:hypothetical protein
VTTVEDKSQNKIKNGYSEKKKDVKVARIISWKQKHPNKPKK